MLVLPLYNKLMRHFVNRDDLPFIHMRSGAKFVHQWPLPEDVNIEDIAHNLSKICRYAGSIEGDATIYSVAEHSVRCSWINAWDFPMHKLLHDATEAYMVDLPRPLKRAPFMGSYRFYEKLAWKEAISIKFNLSVEEPPEVKYADKIMLVTEKRDLFSQDRVMCLTKMDDVEGIQPQSLHIEPWSPKFAKEAFLRRYEELSAYRREIGYC